MKYHYVYRITNKLLNKHYYGVRTAKVHPCADLGIIYFSSSRDNEFISDQKENFKNYKYKVIKIFKTREEAILLEIKLHNKFDVCKNESFYNKSKQTSTGWDTAGTRYVMSDETKQKIGNANRGRIISDLGRFNMSNARIGYVTPLETKRKMSLSHKGNQYCLGNTASNATKLKMTNSQKKRWADSPMPMLICPHCGKEGRGGAMTQWHFDNCKKKDSHVNKN